MQLTEDVLRTFGMGRVFKASSPVVKYVIRQSLEWRCLNA